MKAVVAAFNQEKALVGAFSVITNLRMDLFEALVRGGGARAVLGCSGSALRVKFSLKIEGNRERWHTGLHCSLHRPRPPCKDKKVIVSSGVVAVILRAAL